MKCAAEFRRIARDSLRGKWAIAVIVGVVAMMLGGVGTGGPEISLDIHDSGAVIELEYAGQTIASTAGNSSLRALFAAGAVYVILATLVLAALFLVLGSIIEVGYARFNLELVDRNEPSFSHLFGYFPHWKTTVCARLLRSVYTLLWSLLLIIPGIIASYSYAMTGFILAEHPDMTASEAITASKRMMSGNRWRLFCLQISFIGWAILCAFTFGIGNLWLRPYREAAVAAFYREISGTERIVDADPQPKETLW